jgi:hypothetical protein
MNTKRLNYKKHYFLMNTLSKNAPSPKFRQEGLWLSTLVSKGRGDDVRTVRTIMQYVKTIEAWKVLEIQQSQQEKG